MSNEPNPYASSSAASLPVGLAFGSGDSESIRRQHLSHEASVQSIGLLYILGGLFGGVCGIAYIAMAGMVFFSPMDSRNGGPQNASGTMVMAITLFVLGCVVEALSVFQLWAGWGCRKFHQPARLGASIIAGVGLLAVPLGTLLGAYVLYLLHSAKGNVVFSDQYKLVIRETPHIRYKGSMIVRVLVIVFLVIVILGTIAAVASTIRW